MIQQKATALSATECHSRVEAQRTGSCAAQNGSVSKRVHRAGVGYLIVVSVMVNRALVGQKEPFRDLNVSSRTLNMILYFTGNQ